MVKRFFDTTAFIQSLQRCVWAARNVNRVSNSNKIASKGMIFGTVTCSTLSTFAKFCAVFSEFYSQKLLKSLLRATLVA